MHEKGWGPVLLWESFTFCVSTSKGGDDLSRNRACEWGDLPLNPKREVSLGKFDIYSQSLKKAY